MITGAGWRGALGAGLLAAALAWSTASLAQVTLRLATQTVAGTAQYDGAARFAELVSAKTNGRVAVKVYGDGALGGDLQIISSLQQGSVEMALMNAGLLNGIAREFAVVDFPFLFASEEEAAAVLDGPMGQKLLGLLPPKGLVGLAFTELGFRHVHNSKHAVAGIADLRGLRLRAVQAPIDIDTLNALGANAVPLPFPDLYHAFEHKFVDGATDPLITIEVLKFDEVQPYLTLTRHVYNPQILLIGKTSFDQLAPADRAALQAAAVEARDYERRIARERTAQALDKLKKTMRVTELDAAEEARMREAVKPVVAKYAKIVGEPFVAEFNAELARLRGKKPN
ncbi:MAG TPA: DctP family TRAP transporter solute-binding subunit [Casimicrobiaceae bacterium]|nr:DctP family TRAP transporter solute-binding subunit [Casimicrobiaceae bacterium]